MISVIISHYDKIDNLSIILDAFKRQSCTNFEVIISEDGNNNKTKEFLKTLKYSFPIKHTSQKDIGFRKNRALNKSIKIAEGNFIVFIDGDCIPHMHFIKEYYKYKNLNYIFYGRRVMLSKCLSDRILNKEKFNKPKLLNLILSNCKSAKEAIYSPIFKLHFKERGLKGCNWGIKKEELIKVNGFDESFVHATVGEDDDIEWRLKKIGLKKFSMKNKAIVYHLFHERKYYDSDRRINLKIMNKNKLNNCFVCKNGLIKN